MMLLGGVVRAVQPDHGVQEAGILWQCVDMVVTDSSIGSQGARVLLKRQVLEIAMSLHQKDLSEANKI